MTDDNESEISYLQRQVNSLENEIYSFETRIRKLEEFIQDVLYGSEPIGSVMHIMHEDLENLKSKLNDNNQT